MKTSKTFISILMVAIAFSSCSQKKAQELAIIPKPLSYTTTSGSLKLTSEHLIQADPARLSTEVAFLQKHLQKQTGIRLETDSDRGTIRLILAEPVGVLAKSEAYQLTANSKNVTITAADPAGIFYGIQTLLQLVGTDGVIPAAAIEDHPRFSWRGFMLDVSRHFFPKEYIMEVLDYLALHKMNTFHWHLTDDQGWRIEIKRYPLLTEVGAWRVDREDEHWNSWTPALPGEEATYGGFYTQEEIKAIVQYANDRHITIIPEIEMPGHTSAVLAAYPGLGCTGKQLQVPSGGLWPITDIYCAGKEETFDFIQNVLTEVLDLFPSTYIHIGGDEANKKEWETCRDCQARIRQEGLADEHELQSYFITRIEKFLNANGRQLIGWDEILEGGLAPNAAVMSWRGMEGGIEAAKSGHPVVMTPTSHCYFDYYQGKPELEPIAIGGYLPLEKVYEFEPVPAELSELERQNILGGQANLWTEYVYDQDKADYMIFPRLSAMAEALWSSPDRKDYEDFATRLNQLLPLYDRYEIQYSKSFANVNLETSFDPDKKEFQVALSNSIGYGAIRYTLDGTDPNSGSALYTTPFSLSQTAEIRAATFVGEEAYSVVSAEKVWIHLATGASVSYQNPWSEKYPSAGESTLTNSLRGSLNIGDGRWQGFSGEDLNVLVDLGSEKAIHRVSLGSNQSIGSWVFYPTAITVELLSEDLDPVSTKTLINELSPRDGNRAMHDFELEFDHTARFVRVIANNLGTCPEWHAGAGSPAWLFVDEIIVE